MSKKTTRMTCTYTADAVVYNYEVKAGEDWKVEESRTYELTKLTGMVYDGPNDTKVTLAAYGLRALLADRTSQLRELGPAAVLEGMDGLYEVLVAGDWNVARKAGGAKRVDMVLVELVAKLKKIPASAAEDVVRKTSAETLEAIKVKFAKEYEVIKAKAQKAATETDLGDLLGEDE